MANGFKAHRHSGGGTMRLAGYPILTTYATSIWNGDMVFLNAGNVEQGITNTAHVGTFLGCKYVEADGSIKFSPYWPGVSDGKTEIEAIIGEDTNVTYAVTDSSGALAVGDACDVVNTGSEDATIGASTMTVGASTNADFTVVRILDATNNIVEVKIA